MNYEYNIKNWKNILKKYMINDNDNNKNEIENKLNNDDDNDEYDDNEYLEPMDFLNEFKEIIITRKKCATTRWFKDEPFILNNLKVNEWMISTINDGNTPFGILHINKIQKMKLIEINNDIAKIENMNNSKDLINLLKKIYTKITDNDQVDVVHFTCCHFIGSST